VTDDDIKSIAMATKALFDSRDIVMRSELATMKAEVTDLRAELESLRGQVKVLPSEMHSSSMRMIATMGEKLAAALPDAVAARAEKTFMRMAVERGMTTEGTPQ
jgi:hypothetical protein